jgi:hypothetical protein
MTDEKDVAQTRLKKLDFKLGIYRHYKGGMYVVFSVSLSEEGLVPLVHYFSLTKKTRWTRTLHDFQDFVYPINQSNNGTTPRFVYVRPTMPAEWKMAIHT